MLEKMSYPFLKEFRAGVHVYEITTGRPVSHSQLHRYNIDELLIILPFIGIRYQTNFELVLKYGEISDNTFYINTCVPLWLTRRRKRPEKEVEDIILNDEDLEQLIVNSTVYAKEAMDASFSREGKKKKIRKPNRYFFSSGMLYPYGWKTLFFKGTYLVTYKGVYIGLDPCEKTLDMYVHKMFTKELINEYQDRVTILYSNEYKSEFIALQDYISYLHYGIRKTKYRELSSIEKIIKKLKDCIYFITGLPPKNWISCMNETNNPPYLRLFNYPKNSFYLKYKQEQEANRLNWLWSSYGSVPINLPIIIYAFLYAICTSLAYNINKKNEKLNYIPNVPVITRNAACLRTANQDEHC